MNVDEEDFIKNVWINKTTNYNYVGFMDGMGLDGYDLVLMLFVLTSISHLFFPSEDPTVSLLASFAAYIIALVIRPVGGAFFGNFGDKFGRKKTMMIKTKNSYKKKNLANCSFS